MSSTDRTSVPELPPRRSHYLRVVRHRRDQVHLLLPNPVRRRRNQAVRVLPFPAATVRPAVFRAARSLLHCPVSAPPLVPAHRRVHPAVPVPRTQAVHSRRPIILPVPSRAR